MSKGPSHTYHLECPCFGEWNRFKRDQTRSYCDGYLDAMQGQLPRIELRMVRSDGKVIRTVEAHDDVGVGMIAGWPTAEQYEAAAEKALEKARKIRLRNAEENSRRESRDG
jgi:hypothetical protein